VFVICCPVLLQLPTSRINEILMLVDHICTLFKILSSVKVLIFGPFCSNELIGGKLLTLKAFDFD